MNKEVGTLYIVGTPIGNLKDITLRAIETLKEVDIILAEDTRQTLKLLNHFAIKKKMISYHRHNEQEKIAQVISLLEEGKQIALVSDAGMPIISDPGQALILYLTTHRYKVEVIPGVTAMITALVKSGMDSTRFSFEGFLSVSKKQRIYRLQTLVNETRTMLFYEAPHKLIYTLKDLYAYLGQRKVCIARELTKIHEEFIYSTLTDTIEKYEQKTLKGEFVIILEGQNELKLEEEKKKQIATKTNTELVLALLANGVEKKEAIKTVAKQKGISKNEVYKDCIEL